MHQSHILTACMLGCFSRVRRLATLWTVACQAPMSMGIFQARILEWVAMPSSRDLPNLGIDPCLLWLLHWRQILYCWTTGEAPYIDFELKLLKKQSEEQYCVYTPMLLSQFTLPSPSLTVSTSPLYTCILVPVLLASLFNWIGKRSLCMCRIGQSVYR